jgi:hypothetical protein
MMMTPTTYGPIMWVNTDENNVSWLSVQVDKWRWRQEIQPQYKTIDSYLEIPITLSWRDGNGDLIVEDRFEITIEDATNEAPMCADVSLSKKRDSRNYVFHVDVEKYLEADMITDDTMMKPYQHLSIESTLELEDLHIDSSIMQECYPKYQLYVKSNRNEDYYLWSETLPELRALGLEGNINFYGYGSDAQIDFTPTDVEILYEYYFD